MSRFDSIEFRRDKLLDDSLVYGHASSLSACEKEGSESIYPPIHGQNSCLIPSSFYRSIAIKIKPGNQVNMRVLRKDSSAYTWKCEISCKFQSAILKLFEAKVDVI